MEPGVKEGYKNGHRIYEFLPNFKKNSGISMSPDFDARARRGANRVML